MAEDDEAADARGRPAEDALTPLVRDAVEDDEATVTDADANVVTLNDADLAAPMWSGEWGSLPSHRNLHSGAGPRAFRRRGGDLWC